MIEELIAAISALVSSGAISAVALILLSISGVLGWWLRAVYLAKEAQAKEHNTQTESHNAQMMQATVLMTTLVEQLRTFGERQQEIQNHVVTAGQNAARNHETLVKIATILEQDSRRR